MIFQFVLNSQLNIYGDKIIVFVVGRTGVGWFVQGQFYSGKNRFQSASPELSSGIFLKPCRVDIGIALHGLFLFVAKVWTKINRGI